MTRSVTIEGRVPPHHLDAEFAFIGCALMEPERMLDEPWALIPADAFYSHSNSQIWQAIQEIRLAQGRVDEITVAEWLDRKGYLEEVGGLSYLSNCRDGAPSVYYAQAHAEIIREKWQLRRLIELFGEGMKSIYDEDFSAQEIAYQIDDQILSVVENRSSEPVSIASAAEEAVLKYQQVQAGTRRRPIFLGITPEIDSNVMLEPGDLMQLMASTGVGKSLLALQIAETVARRGTPALYYSLEMPSEQKGERVLVQKTGANLANLRTGQMTPAELQQFQTIISNLRNVPLWIQDKLETEAHIMADIRRQVKQRGIGLVVLDYLGLIEGDDGDKRYLMLNKISRRMKRLAVKLGISIIVLNQLNKEAEGTRPTLGNSADSYGIQRDADVVAMVWRQPDSNNRLGNFGEFIIGKGRNVKTGIYKIKYNETYMRFERV